MKVRQYPSPKRDVWVIYRSELAAFIRILSSLGQVLLRNLDFTVAICGRMIGVIWPFLGENEITDSKAQKKRKFHSQKIIQRYFESSTGCYTIHSFENAKIETQETCQESTDLLLRFDHCYDPRVRRIALRPYCVHCTITHSCGKEMQPNQSFPIALFVSRKCNEFSPIYGVGCFH